MKHTMLYIFYLENMNIEIAFDAIPVKELTALSLSLSLSLSLLHSVVSYLSYHSANRRFLFPISMTVLKIERRDIKRLMT